MSPQKPVLAYMRSSVGWPRPHFAVRSYSALPFELRSRRPIRRHPLQLYGSVENTGHVMRSPNERPCDLQRPPAGSSVGSRRSGTSVLAAPTNNNFSWHEIDFIVHSNMERLQTHSSVFRAILWAAGPCIAAHRYGSETRLLCYASTLVALGASFSPTCH
jgi:hypothetical protein